MTVPTHPGQRPATVSISTYLLWGTAALVLLQSIISLSMVSRTTSVYEDLYQGSSVPDELAQTTSSILVVSIVGGAVLYVLLAAAFAILAIFNNRGRNGARITTWVLGGLMVCCGGVGLAGQAASGPLSSFESANTTGGGPTSSEIQAALDSALPGWYQPTVTTLNGLWVLITLAALVLLALPASNAFFRRPARGFDPSMPYPAYPGGQPPYPQPQYPTSGPPQQQPQYPTYPTYPAGQQPPYPQAQPPGQPPAQPQGPPPAQPPHPPSSDPWSRPEGDDRPPTDPTAQP